ncbi:MAG: nuclear transport factor 2 family protein, partial [Aeromicrobium erythreum]
MSNDTTTQSLSLDELPAVVRAFTAAHLEHDLEREMVSFADDATVVDDGRTYSGVGEIRPWLARAAGE